MNARVTITIIIITIIIVDMCDEFDDLEIKQVVCSTKTADSERAVVQFYNRYLQRAQMRKKTFGVHLLVSYELHGRSQQQPQHAPILRRKVVRDQKK